jgi:hypothetical protein
MSPLKGLRTIRALRWYLIITKRKRKSNVFLQIDNFFIKAFSGVIRPGFYKPFYASVVGFFHLLREKASGQFTPGAVVGHALAADAPLRARSIGTDTAF